MIHCAKNEGWLKVTSYFARFGVLFSFICSLEHMLFSCHGTHRSRFRSKESVHLWAGYFLNRAETLTVTPQYLTFALSCFASYSWHCTSWRQSAPFRPVGVRFTLSSKGIWCLVTCPAPKVACTWPPSQWSSFMTLHADPCTCADRFMLFFSIRKHLSHRSFYVTTHSCFIAWCMLLCAFLPRKPWHLLLHLYRLWSKSTPLTNL